MPMTASVSNRVRRRIRNQRRREEEEEKTNKKSKKQSLSTPKTSMDNHQDDRDDQAVERETRKKQQASQTKHHQPREIRVDHQSGHSSYRSKTSSTTASASQVMDASKLKKWCKISPREFCDFEKTQENHEKVYETSPFPVNDLLNSKVALWAGDVTLLNCQAIVNTTNENFSDRSPLSLRILTKGGPSLRYHIRENVRSCRTGDAKITRGYDLPARYVIHTVGPKYNKKYHTAAEGALYSAYSKVLQLAREETISTLGLCPINSIRRGYPPHEGAHVALRVVRRFLEKYSGDFDLIVFAVEDVDVGIYELLMPLYFPRSPEEEHYAQYYLPDDVGGMNGEPVIPERQIRISVKPMLSHQISSHSGKESTGGQDRKKSSSDHPSESDGLNDLHEDFDDASIDLETGLESSVAVGKTPFAKMNPDVDRRWTKPQEAKRSNKSSTDPMTLEVQRHNRYERLLRKSRQEDYTDLDNMRFLYTSGVDKLGRAVVVFVGHRFILGDIERERLLSYIISVMDPLVNKEYVIVYFHTLTSSSNVPSMSFVKYVLETLEYKYKKNLSTCYVVHPTLWCRVVSWWFTNFYSSSRELLRNKILFLGGVEYLRHVISLDQLQVPSLIMDFDFKNNGVGYSHTEAGGQLFS